MFDTCLSRTYDGEHGWATHVEIRPAKRHTYCCECRAPIARGEQCEYVRGFWRSLDKLAGSWTHHTCITCTRVRESLVRGDWVYGELWDMVEHAYCEDPGDREAMLPETYLEMCDVER